MLSLTTDLGISFPEQNLLDKATNKSSCGKANTVVSKLVINWRQLNSAECNVSFFHNLLSKNISTRDIHSFVKKQADLPDDDKNVAKIKLNGKEKGDAYVLFYKGQSEAGYLSPTK